jgi:hypothetical protein
VKSSIRLSASCAAEETSFLHEYSSSATEWRPALPIEQPSILAPTSHVPPALLSNPQPTSLRYVDPRQTAVQLCSHSEQVPLLRTVSLLNQTSTGSGQRLQLSRHPPCYQLAQQIFVQHVYSAEVNQWIAVQAGSLRRSKKRTKRMPWSSTPRLTARKCIVTD